MKILVIDDDPAMTDLLKLILTSTGVDVITTDSGTEGIRIIEEQSPSLVILDLMMPNMDGWQTTSKIRSFSSVPIIIHSVIDNPGLVARALDAGADDFICKPTSGRELVAHINNLIRRGDPYYLETTPLQLHALTI